MTPVQRVLITGINGYIGVHTARAFLSGGWHVRGTVRPSADRDAVLRALDLYRQIKQPSSEAAEARELEIYEVPDIAADGAFDDAIRDVHAVIHCASPVSTTATEPEPMMRAAVRGTTSLLASARTEARRRGKSKSNPFRTVVFLSSFSAIVSPSRPAGHVFTEADWNDDAEEEVRRLGKNASGYVVYQASKAAAERAFWRVGEEVEMEAESEGKGGFDMVALCPALVLGPPLFLPNPIDKLSIRALDIYNLYHGGPIPAFSPNRSAFVDVRDLARLTFKAVEKSATSVKRDARERYMVVGESGVSPQRMVDVLRREFPHRRDVIVEGNPGETYPEMTWRFDAGKAGALMGEPWVGFDRSVVETAEVFASV
ncbi:uncharacterized protein C8A04DRAFT_12281 [Dichotomopilus funicola]|uniref:NAD-dependent epimerase/dehydratase domain-containing protein n=1 Tax=Dichotomopilus funicola TaxID=1934379 RepID=A0AAN6V3X9_9PEZI|nr:hypothetical protein C8A04DRAFT_12281 [Dichotomopilus funicola]